VSIRYLLPCPCGKTIPVETAQAGQIVRCACGKDIEVPTLLRLRSLDTADEEPKTAARGSWGIHQGLTIVGAAIMLVAAASLVFFYLHRPVPPEDVFTEEIVQRYVDNMTLLQSEGDWRALRLGPGHSPPIDPTYRRALKTYWVSKYATVDEAYHGAVKQYHIRIGASLVVLVLAAAATIVGRAAARAKPRGNSFDAPIDSSP